MTEVKLVTAPPLSHQAAEMIIKKIESGELKAGDRLKPIRKLAGELSVGRQVIVSAIEILEKKGLVLRKEGCAVFVREKVAEALRIGLYLEKLDFDREFHAELLLQLNVEAASFAEIVPGFSGREKNIKTWASDKKLDGIIASGDINDASVKKLRNSKLPFVIAGNYELKEKVNIVMIDHEEASFEIFDYLINNRNIKTMGAICGPRKQLASREIELGIKKAAEKNKLKAAGDFLSFTVEENGFASMENFKIKQGALPDALFVSSQAFGGVAEYIISQKLDEAGKKPIIIKSLSHNEAFSRLIDIASQPSGDSLAAASLKLIGKIIEKKTEEDIEMRLPIKFEFIKKGNKNGR